MPTDERNNPKPQGGSKSDQKISDLPERKVSDSKEQQVKGGMAKKAPLDI